MSRENEPGPEQSASGPANAPESRHGPSEDGHDADPSGLLPRRFMPAHSEPAHDAGSNRDAPGARVSRSGLTHLNVEATQIALKAAGYPPDFGSMGVYLAADPVLNEIGGRLVRSGYKGLTPMRYISRNRTMVIYLHTIFRDYPQLRPRSEKWVAVSPQTEGGTAFFLIQLGLGLRRKRGSRDSGSNDERPTG